MTRKISSVGKQLKCLEQVREFPLMYSLMYLQAFHLDTEFYDRFYRPGSYLYKHAQHDKDWH